MLPLPSFAYVAPGTIEEALQLLALPAALPVAGGTDLLPSMKQRLFRPSMLVSLRRLTALRERHDDPVEGLSLGAGLTLAEIARDPAVRARYPALAEACAGVATPTIQAMATLGGNVLLDTRCVFYNQPEGWREALGGCLKRDGSVCHVAPRGKGCYAAHSADTVPVLWLYGAVVEVVGAAGPRHIPIHDLYRPDGMDWHKVKRGEILTRVILPPGPPAVSFRKSRARAAIDYAYLLVAAARDADGFRAVVSAVGPMPTEVRAGTPEGLAEVAYESIQPLATHLIPAPYRKRMIRVEVRRAAEKVR